MSEYIQFKNIKKVFPGQVALNGVSFGVKKGEVHALLGENGAGKSTLLNIFHGVFPATDGEVLVEGNKVCFANTFEAIKFGIAKVHQEINLVPEMTVMDNLLLGCEYQSGILLDKKKMYSETQKLLDLLKCRFKPTDKVKELNVGEKQMLQIAKALNMNAKVISFDEPTSSLSNKEVDTLFKVIEDLKNQGITILYISHKLDEIYRICDRATILRDGQYIGTYELKDLSKESMIKYMVGRDVSMFAKRHKPSRVVPDEVVLRVENLSGAAGYENLSFELKKGEILGFFGLVGAKRTEVMRGIFGADKLTEGSITLKGKPIINNSPAEAVKNGIGLIPENRKEQGFVKDLNNYENISLASSKKYEVGVLQSNQRKIDNAVRTAKKVGLSPNNPHFMTKDLSGGNQQKVILAKWLSTDTDVIIFDEPTKGIDVGSKADIYALMEELLEEGKSIIMVSSELPEVIGMSDRIIVMREGKIAAIMNRDEFSEQAILSKAVGGQ